MKVGIFTDTYKPQINGVVTSIALMEKKLLEHGHEPYIFTVKHPEVNRDQDPDYVFRVPSVKFWGNEEHRIGMIYSPYAARKAKKIGIEIIHSHAPFSLGLFGHIAARTLRIPEIQTYHTMLEDYVHYVKMNRLLPGQTAQKYSKIFCNMVNGVIVPTQKVHDKLISYGVSKPMYILPTGVDLANFQRQFSEEDRINLRERYGLTPEDKVLIFVGRIAKEKSINVLISYLQKLIRVDQRFKLFVVGNGEYLVNLKSYVRELNLQKNVIFAGKKEYTKLPYYYNLADCFVIASTSETQGLVVVEAMATGLPVIAVDDESFYPMVSDRVNGYFFKDQDEYVDRVLNLFYDTELLKKFSHKSQEIANEFSADRFYEKLIEIYNQVIDNYYLN